MSETSRYAISTDDLKRAAKNISLGQGIAERIDATDDASIFIAEAELWVEERVADYIGVPLKPIRAMGEASVPTTLTKRNYPLSFILAVTYRALALLLNSEFFESAPNKSEAAAVAQEEAEKLIQEFRSNRTFRVGGGRLRHPNPHMPPNIAPREETDRDRPSAGRK